MQIQVHIKGKPGHPSAMGILQSMDSQMVVIRPAWVTNQATPVSELETFYFQDCRRVTLTPRNDLHAADQEDD